VGPQHEDRRLITILAADIVGYSRLMAADESGTFARLRAHRKELIEPKTAEYHGRVVKLTGDGALMEFGSVVDAVLFAIDVQRAMEERDEGISEEHRIRYRIGINIGDIIVDGEDIYGDGINVAARLEAMAEPGSVYVSRSVYNQTKGKIGLGFEDLGEKLVKNIPEPVRVYRVDLYRTDTESVSRGSETGTLPIPDKTSIAVLPFQNMSGDPEQEFFADGMAEDIITALSHYRWFFVIARNSSFTYKNRAVDVTQVARELGVRYVLEGSVRKAGNRVRVTAQLIDATTGNHIWAERYDRELDDIFVLQDEITETIVASVEPELGMVERERARRKLPENLDAWSSYQRGLWHLFDDVKRDSLAEAKRLFQRACELDPDFAPAHAELAYTQVAEIIRGLTDDPMANLDAAADAAERAVSLDSRDAAARCALGRVHIFRHAYERAIGEMKAALRLNASFDRACYGLGLALLCGGKPKESISQFETGIRLSPRSPVLWAYWMMVGLAYINLQNYEDAAASFDKAVQQPNAAFMPFAYAAAALGQFGRIEEADSMLVEAKKRNPKVSITTIRNTVGLLGQNSGMDWIIDGLRKAGLPEQ
jgi:adenylate cyclase